MVTSLSQVRESFYLECEDKYGFAREEVIKILSEMDNSFKEENIPDYRLRVASRYYKRLEISAKAKALGRPESDIACPICGATTIGEPALFGKYTRTPGWVCSKGGIRHFIWWKANKIRANHGQGPIDFASIDWANVKLHTQMETTSE